jgi:hypothetical protein
MQSSNEGDSRVLIEGLAHLRARHGSLPVATQTILFNEGVTSCGSQSFLSSFNLARRERSMAVQVGNSNGTGPALYGN